jgi:spore germination protein KC
VRAKLPRIARLAAGALAALLGSLATVGCWGVPAIDRQGLVSIIGVDLDPHGGYRVTLDVVNAAGLPSPTGAGQSGSGQPVFVRSASAATLAQAVTEVARATQSGLDQTHLQGILVSEPFARQGLTPLLNFSASTAELTPTSWLFVVRNETAEELLKSTMSSTPQPGLTLLQTALYGQRVSPALAGRIEQLDFKAGIRGDDFTTLGVQADTQQGTGKQAAFQLDGTAMFDGVRLAGWLDQKNATAWLMDAGLLHGIHLTVTTSQGPLTATVLSSRRQVRVDASTTPPRVDITTTLAARIDALPHKVPLNARDPQTMAMLESETAAALWTSGAAAIADCQRLESDSLGLGQHVRIDDPDYWRTVGATWETGAFRTLPVRLTVTVRLTPSQTLCSVGDTCSPDTSPAAP